GAGTRDRDRAGRGALARRRGESGQRAGTRSPDRQRDVRGRRLGSRGGRGRDGQGRVPPPRRRGGRRAGGDHFDARPDPGLAPRRRRPPQRLAAVLLFLLLLLGRLLLGGLLLLLLRRGLLLLLGDRPLLRQGLLLGDPLRPRVLLRDRQRLEPCHRGEAGQVDVLAVGDHRVEGAARVGPDLAARDRAERGRVPLAPVRVV